MNISFSVVFGSGWKMTYLVGGRERGVPLMLKKISQDQDDTSNSRTSSQPIAEKIKSMKKAQVIDAEFEVIRKENSNGDKPR